MDQIKIILSDHAKNHLKERLKCKDAKNLKIAKKAWRSKEPLDMREVANFKFHNKNHDQKEYKKFLGLIFVFSKIVQNTTMLITVMPPTTQMARKRSQRKIILGSDVDTHKNKSSLLKTIANV